MPIESQRTNENAGAASPGIRLAEITRTPARDSSPNRLLSALPSEEYGRLAADLSPRRMKLRETLYADGEPLTHVLFPGRSVCSVLQTMEDGAAIEVAMVGNEGLLGLAAADGDPSGWGRAIVQIEGERAQAVSVSAFNREMARGGSFSQIVSTYAKAFNRMIMVRSACHGLHSAEARCCSWLLGTHDRLARDEFLVTHDALASVLGVRRPTVTLVLSDLVRGGVLAQRRGQIRVVNREALEGAACECYRNMRDIFRRWLP